MTTYTLQAVRVGLEEALGHCRRLAAKSGDQKATKWRRSNPKDGMSTLFMERQRSVATFWAVCQTSLKAAGFENLSAFLGAIIIHRHDPVVQRLAGAVEATLDCQPSCLFGIVKEPPNEISLQLAREIMDQVSRCWSTKDLKEAMLRAVFERRWRMFFPILHTMSLAYGFGVDGVFRMLGAVMAHGAEPEVAYWIREFERVTGLPALDWSAERAGEYVDEFTGLYSTEAHKEERLRLDAAHVANSPEWIRSWTALQLKTEAPLLQEHGLDVSVRGLIVRLLNICIHQKEPRVGPFMSVLNFHVLQRQPHPHHHAAVVSAPAAAAARAAAEATAVSGSTADGHEFRARETALQCLAASAPAAREEEGGSSTLVCGDPSSKIAVLEHLVSAKDQQIACLSARLVVQGRDLKEVWSRAVTRDKEIAMLTARIAEKDALVSQLSAEVQSKDRWISALAGRVAEYSDELSHIQEEVLATKQLVADLASESAWQAEAGCEQEGVQEQYEIDSLHDRLLHHMQSASFWKAEALDMYSRNTQLEAELQESVSIRQSANQHFGVHEEHLEWSNCKDYQRSDLQRGCYGWSQIDAQFRSTSAQYQLAAIELVQSKWLELGCQSQLLLRQQQPGGLGVLAAGGACFDIVGSSHSQALPLLRVDCPSFSEEVHSKEKAALLDLLVQHRVSVPGGRADLIWAWHSCDPSAVDEFARAGFANASVAEPGIFGKGHYCHLEAKRACERAVGYPATDDGRWCIVLVLVVLGGAVRPISWCERDFHMRDPADPADCKHYGQRLKKPGSAHIVPVQWRGDEYLIAEGPGEYHEIVVDQDAQVLPFAICWFR